MQVSVTAKQGVHGGARVVGTLTSSGTHNIMFTGWDFSGRTLKAFLSSSTGAALTDETAVSTIHGGRAAVVDLPTGSDTMLSTISGHSSIDAFICLKATDSPATFFCKAPVVVGATPSIS